jgi:hypothetical protein
MMQLCEERCLTMFPWYATNLVHASLPRLITSESRRDPRFQAICVFPVCIANAWELRNQSRHNQWQKHLL